MNNQSNNPNNKLDKQLIRRFLDMANCADASYAMLHLVEKDKDGDGKKIGYINPDNGSITTYARAVESRFNADKPVEGGWLGWWNWLHSFHNVNLVKDTISNDITELPKDTKPDQISQRTKDFVSRFEFIEHQENTKINDFSATLFKDTGMIEGKKVKDKEQYIFAIRENRIINHLEVCNGYK